MAAELHRALTMPAEERLVRMRSLRRRVLSFDVHNWVRTFLDCLDDAGERARLNSLAPTRSDTIAALSEKMRTASRLLLILGYDGTLVPFASAPELSNPDASLLDLLRALAARPRTEIHLVSGSSRHVVEQRFGALPIHLHAEYGFWSRPWGARSWSGGELPVLEWRESVLRMLESFTTRTPGSLIEEKTVSIAWHYRMADPEYGAFQANELTIHLTQFLSNAPVEIVTDDKIIEVRAVGVNKGIVVTGLLADAKPGTLVVAMGDDRNDEDLFAALEGHGIAVHVGPGASRAEIRLPDIDSGRRMLASVLRPPAAKPDTSTVKSQAARRAGA
jgi:trehalose 6-phosphate synthase/phosphatase